MRQGIILFYLCLICLGFANFAEAQSLQHLAGISMEKKNWSQIAVLEPKVSASTLKNEPQVVKKEVPEIMIFWTSWCPHCKELLGDIHRLNLTIPDVSFDVTAVSLDENEALAKEVLQNLEWKLPMYFDSSLKTKSKYKIAQIPFIVVLDSKKKPVRAIAGYSDERMQLIRKILVSTARKGTENE